MTLKEALNIVANEILLDSGPEGLAQIISALDIPTDDWVQGQDVSDYYRRKFLDYFERLE
jgi:hypothetical protein